MDEKGNKLLKILPLQKRCTILLPIRRKRCWLSLNPCKQRSCVTPLFSKKMQITVAFLPPNFMKLIASCIIVEVVSNLEGLICV
jgi:hypothetical protein